MSFGAPEMLWVLWALPLLVLLFAMGAARRRRIMARFGDPEAVQRLSQGLVPWRRVFKACCVAACVAAAALALARPQIGFHWKEIERKGVEIMVALDCSRSMLAEDVKPSRLKRAKREIVDLVNMLEGDRIGLTSFAGTAFVQCPLTLDYTALNLFLNVMGPDQMPVGGTDLAAAVNTALDGFDQHSDADKGIILITDGESTIGDPIMAAERAKQMGVRIFTVGVGADQGAPVPEKKGSGFKRLQDGSIKVSRLDEATLRKMAEITGGRYVRSVTGDMDLETIYREGIRKELEAKTLKSGREKILDERFQWFLGAALVFLLLDLFTGTGAGTGARTGTRTNSGTKIAVFLLIACSMVLGMVSAPPARADMDQGMQAYEQKQYDRAAKEMVQEQLGNPDDPNVFYNLGNAYYRSGEFEKARNNYAAALKGASPELRAKAMYNLGNAEYRLERFEEAERAYQRALEMTPDDKDAQRNLELAKRRKEMQKQQQQNQQQNQQGGQKGGSDKNKGSDSKSGQGSQGQDGQNQDGQKGQNSQAGQDGQKQSGAQQNGQQAGNKDGSKDGEQKAQQGRKPGDQDGNKDANKNGNMGGQKDGQKDNMKSGGLDGKQAGKQPGDKDGDKPEDKNGSGAQSGDKNGKQSSADREKSGDDGAGKGKLEEMPGQKQDGAGGDSDQDSDKESSEDNVDRFRGTKRDDQTVRDNENSGENEVSGSAGQTGAQQNFGRQGRGVRSDVLNRVKDQPGRGMVPSYGRRNVERDW